MDILSKLGSDWKGPEGFSSARYTSMVSLQKFLVIDLCP